MTTPRLDPSIRAGWIKYNRDLEGIIPWPYLCFSLVWTVAIGVTPSKQQAYGYRWIVSATRQPATRADVDEAWDALNGLPVEAKQKVARGGAAAARKLVKIELPADELERVTLERFDQFEVDMIRRYPALPSWPVEAQTVCMSIAWAAGTAAAFPKMYAAMGRGDWLTAADECYLRVDNPDGSRNEGLIPRNRRNRALLESLAARLGQTRTVSVDAVPDPAPTQDEPPDTDPMTDAQRRETLALVEATYEQASRDAITEAFRSR